VGLCSGWGLAQGLSTSAPTTIPAGEIAATVNGYQIRRAEIEEQIQGRTPLEVLKHPAAAGILDTQRLHLLETLIDDRLLDEQVEAAGLTISDAEMAREVQEEMEGYLAVQGITREQLECQLLFAKGQTLEEFLTSRISDVKQRRAVLRKRLIEQMVPAAGQVTDEEVAEFYKQRLERRFKKPEQVRASHILIGTENASSEQKADARKRAEEILAEARQPGADFAALAARYSTCRSKVRGGDVGYFGRQDWVPESFATAAFALQVGQISDIVETPRGYHILKVTDRTGPQTLPLEKVGPGIRMFIKDRKLQEELRRYASELRATAQIVYAPGFGPTATGPASPLPTSQPAH